MVHDFKVTIDPANYEGALGLKFQSSGGFMIAKDGEIIVYDDSSYRENYKIDLKLE
jgi:hypothetical protein